MTASPPEYVLAAFGAGTVQPEALEGGQGSSWRVGDVVLKPVQNPVEASWLAGTFESVRVPGIRLARPVRSSDGRWVVGGWSAHKFVAGQPARRYDEILAAGEALHSALAEVPPPRFLKDRDDLYSWADRLAWGEVEDTDSRLGGGHGSRLFAELAAGRRPVDLPHQVVHGDLFGNVLFAGTAPPAVIDITPYWRPPSWAAAVVAVDALTWGGADTDLLERWQHLDGWPQMLRRALLFRLSVSLAHPRSTAESLVEMLAAAEVITPHLG